MKGQFGLLLTLAAVLLLCGCQPTPDTEAVTSKNDGALEAALESTAIPAAATAGVQTCSYTDSFQNTAGNITYTVDAQNVEISVTALPVLQVTPHAFTGEEAQTIAAAIFGDAEAYEYTAERSRAELEEAILEKRRFLSDRAALLEIYGGDEEMADAAAAEAEDSLANLEALYQTAPDTVERQPCQWTFYPQSHYDDPAQAAVRIGDDDEVRLCKVSVTADGVPYVFLATNMDSSGYRLHTVSVCVDTQRLTAAEIADAVYSRTRPTEEETAAVRQKTEDMLAAMDIGQWTGTSCEVSGGEDDSGPYFLQTVTACPVYEGLALTPVGETGTGSGYIDDYDDAAIRFTFSGGRLVSFDYTGPLDIVRTVNENVQTLSFDELTSRFRQQMELSDTSAFQADVPEELAASLPQIASAAVTADGIAFGLARVRIQNNGTDFYLLPAYIFTGSYLLTYADGTAEESPAGTVLAVLNAVDGSVIDTSQGY